MLELLVHDLPQRRQLLRIPAHKGMLTGLCFADADRVLSCGHDRTVKMWSVDVAASASAIEEEAGLSESAVRASSLIKQLDSKAISPRILLRTF
jgi:DDB1- and CUL4-associated factor 13